MKASNSKSNSVNHLSNKQKLALIIRENLLHIVVISFLLFFMLYKLGSYPNWFDSCVEHAIHPQVNNVLDGTPMTEMTWKWTDMHQHAGGVSPVYGWSVWMGLKIFGLSLIGVRLFPAFVAFFSILLLYFSVGKHFGRSFSLIFITLLATSPWYLINARSGGIVGFGMSLVSIAISTIALMYSSKANVHAAANKIPVSKKTLIISLLSGIFVGLIPYGHAGTRAFAPLMILFVIFTCIIKKIKPQSLVAFLLGCFLLFVPQLNSLQDSLHIYFNARGESMLAMAKNNPEQKFDLQFVQEKMKENVELLSKQLLTTNADPGTDFLWPNIADSYNIISTVLYPRFLVPFLLFGMLITVYQSIKKKNIFYLVPFVIFIISLFPSIMSGLGIPNPARNCLACPPMYFFISYSLFIIGSQLLRFSEKRLKFSMLPLLILIFALIPFYQLSNFYLLEKGTNDEKVIAGNHSLPLVEEYLKTHPDATIVFHEFPPFGIYGYSGLRWLGGDSFEKRLKNKQFILLKNENAQAVNQQILDGKVDLIVSSYPSVAEELLPNTALYRSEQVDVLKVYYIK